MIVDKRGHILDRETLLERIALYDVHCLMRGMDNGDFDWVHKIMRSGHYGLSNYTDKQLKAEWKDIEEGFFSMIEEQRSPYTLDDDPQFVRKN
tara:strand:- start:817 stop:1095 length:279 start_codon:yes stop_codon:yes gene_type:complete